MIIQPGRLVGEKHRRIRRRRRTKESAPGTGLSSGGRTRTVLMEPHDLAREALVQYLQEQDGIAVVVGCATTREAAALVQRVRADVILLSVDGCVEGVGASLTAIRQGRPAVRVLLLSGEESEELAETVVAERVHGLLTKTKPLVEWLAAVQEIAEGGTYFGEEIGSRLVVGPEGLRLGAIG